MHYIHIAVHQRNRFVLAELQESEGKHYEFAFLYSSRCSGADFRRIFLVLFSPLRLFSGGHKSIPRFLQIRLPTFVRFPRNGTRASVSFRIPHTCRQVSIACRSGSSVSKLMVTWLLTVSRSLKLGRCHNNGFRSPFALRFALLIPVQFAALIMAFNHRPWPGWLYL